MNYSYIVVPVLEFLYGQPYDTVAKILVGGLRPTDIRVTTGEIKSDSKEGRVTVYLDEILGFITRIVQEQEIPMIEEFIDSCGQDIIDELYKRNICIG